nr:CoA ester lyase [Brevibacterium sp. RIT 803]
MSAVGPGWLFVPADRPERFAKAIAAADMTVIDLEDAVRHDDKARAREVLRSAELDPVDVCIRVNGFGTDHIDEDLKMVRDLGITRVMVPMAEAGQPFASLTGFHVIALIETAKGVLEADQIAAHTCVEGLALGSVDLQLDLGARGSAALFDNLLVFARMTVLFAGRAHKTAVIDSVHPTVTDEPGLREAAAAAAAYGFDGKMGIHPRQIETIRSVFAPDERELRWAQNVTSEAGSRQVGAFMLDGELIDDVVIRRAERLLKLSP